MRIAVVTETFYPFIGGSSKRYLEVFSRIVEMGYSVHVYTVRLKPSWPEEETIRGIRVSRLALPWRGFITSDGFRSVWDVLKFTTEIILELMNDGDYDVIEANHCPIIPTWGSKLISLAKKVPLSVTFHEVWHSHWYYYVPYRILAPMGIILEKTLKHVPDVAVAVSRMTGERLNRYLGIGWDRIRIISNGVDLELYNGTNVDKDRYKIVYVGRLLPHKRVEMLLQAFKIVKEKVPEAKLEIIGDGPLRPKLERYSRTLNLRDVVFTGAIDDEKLAVSLKAAGIYVLPSMREGQSITTLEAMAAGTPQIVTDFVSNAAVELVKESGSGIVVRSSPRDLAEAIMKLMSSDELWTRLRDNGLRYVVNFTWERAAKEHLDVYQELIERRLKA
ncbi:MAG: glycosyltransferase family 4 protein [Thermoprotei archaeon]|nr:glycosyltransferase family 4 protein [Thermoprotei archaeon]